MGKVVELNPFLDSTDKCERLGYAKFEKRLATILNAGLTLQMARDAHFSGKNFDSFKEDDLKHPPPLARHLEPDLAEVSELSRFYSQKKADIEARLRAKRDADALERRQALAKAEAAGGGLQPPRVEGEAPVEPKGSKK